MRKQILLLLILLLPLVSCNGYTIPEDALYPLKIGVLAVEEGTPSAHCALSSPARPSSRAKAAITTARRRSTSASRLRSTAVCAL